MAILRKIRMKGDRIKPLLDKARLNIAAQRVDIGEIEERILLDIAVLVDDLNSTDPLDNEDPPRAIAGGCDIDRIRETFCNLDQCEFRVTRQLAPIGARHLVLSFRNFLCDSGSCRSQRNE